MILPALLMALAPVPSSMDRSGFDSRFWESYNSKIYKRGLQIKPLVLIYTRKMVIINSEKMDERTAIRLVVRTKSVTPRPPLQVNFRSSDRSAVLLFARKLESEGLCSPIKCRFRIMH